MAAALALAVSGCAGRTATVAAAPDAANPNCASAMIAMPDELGGHSLRPTDSQATAVWGDPSVAVLRCGIEPPGPTTDQCVSAGGVDWVVRDEDTAWRIETYGRTPAVEVLFGKDQVSSDVVMMGLGSAVSQIEASGGCVNLEDAQRVG